MVIVGFGAAAVTAEKGKELLEGLNARGVYITSCAMKNGFAMSDNER